MSIHYQYIRKFGRNQAVGTTFVPVVSSGAAVGFRPSAAASTTLVSADPDDTLLGAGARTVEVQGVDANGTYIHETVSLNGGTTPALDTEFLFIHRMVVRTAGASAVNEGIVTAQHGATVIAQMDAGWSQTEICAFYFSDARNGGAVRTVRVSMDGSVNAAVNFQLWTKTRSTGVEHMVGMLNLNQNQPAYTVNFTVPSSIPAGTYVWIEAKVSTGTADVGAAMDIQEN